MRDTYDAVYEDRRGRESTTITNDGRELRMSVRGVDFVGTDFDALSPVAAHLARARSLFELHHDDLCACRLEWGMPLLLERVGQRIAGRLSVVLVLGEPLPTGALGSEALTLTLETPVQTIRSSGTSGWFEDELLELCRALPSSTRVRSCITCAFSDYSPHGHGLFGDLACFRDVKDDYVKVVDKPGIFAIWNRLTEFVQETHVCDEFAPRTPGAGYRG